MLMSYIFLVGNYLVWHYTRGVVELCRNWLNLVKFAVRFFSLPVLIETLFAPWKRLDEKKETGFHPGKSFESAILNAIMRLIGFGVRFATLLVGSLVVVFVAAMGPLAFVVWVTLPFILASAAAVGLALIFKKEWN